MKNKILVVDDDPLVLDVSVRLVEHASGCAVERCAGAAEALRVFSADPAAFACVVTDLDMPGMNGLELGRRLRALAPGLRMFLATGNPRALDFTGVKQIGFECVLAKPLGLATIGEALLPVLPVLNNPPPGRRDFPAAGAMLSGPCGNPLPVT